MNNIMTALMSKLSERQELILRASIGIKKSLETAKEEMIWRGSNQNGHAWKEVEKGLELINQVIKCLQTP